MTTKSYELIEKVRKALEPKYEFPYYALIRVHSKIDGTFHIPAPMFNGMTRRSKWAGSLPIAGDKRDGEYYGCPFCGEKSFYSGVCEECRRDFEVWEKDGYDGQWVDGPLPLEYRNHEAMKNAAKDELLRRIDTGVPDLGIYSAEIVLPVAWGAEWDPSPFLKSESWSAEKSLDIVESIVSTVEKLKGNEAFKRIWNAAADKYTPPFGILEGEDHWVTCYLAAGELCMAGYTDVRVHNWGGQKVEDMPDITCISPSGEKIWIEY